MKALETIWKNGELDVEAEMIESALAAKDAEIAEAHAAARSAVNDGYGVEDTWPDDLHLADVIEKHVFRIGRGFQKTIADRDAEIERRCTQVDGLQQTLDEITVSVGSVGALWNDLPGITRQMRQEIERLKDQIHEMLSTCGVCACKPCASDCELARLRGALEEITAECLKGCDPDSGGISWDGHSLACAEIGKIAIEALRAAGDGERGAVAASSGESQVPDETPTTDPATCDAPDPEGR